MYRGDYYREEHPVSYVIPLIVLNAIVFFICESSRFVISPQIPSVDKLTELFKFHPYLVVQRLQLWRLVTYMFLHGDFSHLFCNMWGLYMFGRPLERILGSGRFLVLYLCSGIIGGLAWVCFNWNMPTLLVCRQNDTYVFLKMVADLPEYLASHPGMTFVSALGGLVGASGAVFGVITAVAMAFPESRVMLLFPPVSMKMKQMIWVYMGIEVLFLFRTNSNVAHLAHLGGALGGFIFYNRLKNHRLD